MESLALPSSSTPTGHRPALIRIVTNHGGRPCYTDGQYVPCHLVHQIHTQMLKGMFASHGLVKLEPCLDPLSGSRLWNLYLATFPDFSAFHGAMRAWHAVELEQNPFICMIVMADVAKDEKLEQLLQRPEEELIELSGKAVTGIELHAPADTFEDWWATTDPHHWMQHLERIGHEETLRKHGPWLYNSEPGSKQVSPDPVSYSYATPACFEYELFGRRDDDEELMEMIDWEATRKMERIAFFPRVDTSLLLMLEHTAINATPTPSPESVDAFGSSSTYVARSDPLPESTSQNLGVFEHAQKGRSAGNGRCSVPGDVTYEYPHFYVTHPPTPPLASNQSTSDLGSGSDSSGSVHPFPLISMPSFGSVDSDLPILAKPLKHDDNALYKFRSSDSVGGIRSDFNMTNAAEEYEPLIVAAFQQSEGSGPPAKDYNEMEHLATGSHAVAGMPVMPPNTHMAHLHNADPIRLWLEGTIAGPEHYSDTDEDVAEKRDDHPDGTLAPHCAPGSEAQQYAAFQRYVQETRDLFVRCPSAVSVTPIYDTFEVCILLLMLPMLDHFSLGLMPVMLRHPMILLLLISITIIVRHRGPGSASDSKDFAR